MSLTAISKGCVRISADGWHSPKLGQIPPWMSLPYPNDESQVSLLCIWDRPGDTGVSKDVWKWFWVLQCTRCQQGFRSWHKLKEMGEPVELAGGTEAWLDGSNEALHLIQVRLWCFPWFCDQTQKETDLGQLSNLNKPSWHSQMLREVRLQGPLALFWSLIKNRSPLKLSHLGWWH